MKLRIDDNKLILTINGLDIKLRFTLDAAIALEENCESIETLWESIGKASTCVDIALSMVNAAVRRYDKEYNAQINPVDIDWLAEELNLTDFKHLTILKLAVVSAVTNGNAGTDSVKGESSKKK
jgi:hypothetical protein